MARTWFRSPFGCPHHHSSPAVSSSQPDAGLGAWLPVGGRLPAPETLHDHPLLDASYGFVRLFTNVTLTSSSKPLTQRISEESL
jgi:hypothetical protein